MRPSYAITNPAGSNVCIFSLSGLFDEATANDFARDLDVALIGLPYPPNTHFSLCDLSTCMVQPQMLVEMCHKITTNARVTARRIAFVTKSSLARRQIQRIVAGKLSVAIFEDQRGAMAWLTEGGAIVPPALSK